MEKKSSASNGSTNVPPKNILDRPLARHGQGSNYVVSQSAFSFLFSEIVQYSQNRVNSIADLERKLENAGRY